MLYQLSYQSCYCAATRDRTRDLQIFSLTLSQLSYRGKEGRYWEHQSGKQKP